MAYVKKKIRPEVSECLKLLRTKSLKEVAAIVGYHESSLRRYLKVRGAKSPRGPGQKVKRCTKQKR